MPKRIKNLKVDNYLANGCGRCQLYDTPDCKARNWTEELIYLRKILLDSGLSEELKWNVPCYTFQGINAVLLIAFKKYCALAFFKGALLKDAEGILKKPGDNSQAVRQLRFTNLKEIIKSESIIKDYIHEAIEVEKAGLKIDFKQKDNLELPEEFRNFLDGNNDLYKAFEALTPGRQRAYNLYFSAPKQSKTRIIRIEKCLHLILAGKGLNDR